MSSVIFDTHAFVKKLTAVGFKEEQAEAIASTQAELINEQLVTRQYLDLRLAETKAEIVKWCVGSVFASVGLFAAWVKLMGN